MSPFRSDGEIPGHEPGKAKPKKAKPVAAALKKRTRQDEPDDDEESPAAVPRTDGERFFFFKMSTVSFKGVAQLRKVRQVRIGWCGPFVWVRTLSVKWVTQKRNPQAGANP